MHQSVSLAALRFISAAIFGLLQCSPKMMGYPFVCAKVVLDLLHTPAASLIASVASTVLFVLKRAFVVGPRFPVALCGRDAHRTSVVIDFAGQLQGLQASSLAYSDLSAAGNAEEAAEGLFRALRWAERQPSAQRLLIAGAC